MVGDDAEVVWVFGGAEYRQHRDEDILFGICMFPENVDAFAQGGSLPFRHFVFGIEEFQFKQVDAIVGPINDEVYLRSGGMGVLFFRP